MCVSAHAGVVALFLSRFLWPAFPSHCIPFLIKNQRLVRAPCETVPFALPCDHAEEFNREAALL